MSKRELETIRTPRQAGLGVFRKGEALEVIRVETGECHLLASGQGMELSLISLNEGEQLVVHPFDEGTEGVEVYYLLEGTLEVENRDGHEPLRKGDYLVLTALDEATMLSALEPVSLLYVSSEPTFTEVKSSMESLMKLAVEVEEKDGYTADHCRRLQKVSMSIARELDLEPHRQPLLSYASYLHDIGKAKVPTEILKKPGKLSEQEWEIMRRHTVYGRQLLAETPWSNAGLIVEQHHERMDGSGYPYGLSGDEILIEAYIIAVADMYDAMTTDRPYRKALHHDVALAEVRKFSGVHYPAEVANAFLKSIDERPPH